MPGALPSVTFSNTGAMAVNADGTPVNPEAYRNALLNDTERMQRLQDNPEILAIVEGNDLEAFAHMVKNHAEAYKKYMEAESNKGLERTIDCQRAYATMPRDTAQVYSQLYDIGLQYGPAFRLLRNIHVPDEEDFVRMKQQQA